MNSARYLLFMFVFLTLSTIGCWPLQSKNTNAISDNKTLVSVPVWAKEAIWYQIFVERFRNVDLSFLLTDDQKMILSYNRKMGIEDIIVVFNRSDETQVVTVLVKEEGGYYNLLKVSKNTCKSINSEIEITLEPLTAAVLKKI